MVYVGAWQHGTKHGAGELYLPNGDSFTAQWNMGQLDGPVQYNFAKSSPWLHPEY